MIEKIVEFILLLKKSNIMISISESLDCTNAINEFDIINKNEFKCILRLTLIKRNDDIEIFNKLFDLFFINERIKINKDEIINIEKIDKDKFEQLIKSFDNEFDEIENEQDDSIEEDCIKEKYENEQDNDECDEEYDDFENNEINNEEHNFEDSCIESDVNNNEFEKIENFNDEIFEVDNTEKNVDSKFVTDEKIKKIINSTDFDGLKIKDANKIAKSQVENNNINKIFEDELKQELIKNIISENGWDNTLENVNGNNIFDVNLENMNILEKGIMKKIISNISKKFMTKLSRNKKIYKRGKFNFKKTITSSMKNCGICSELIYERRKPKKNKIIFICDVSGSMIPYIKVLLQFAIGVKKCFDTMNICCFSDKADDVGDVLLNIDDIDKFNSKLSEKKLGFGTNYLSSFEFVLDSYELNNKTIIVVIGDGEDIPKKICFNKFEDIVKKCKKTFWLYPHKTNNEILEKFCYISDESYKCSTLKDIMIFTDSIKKISM